MAAIPKQHHSVFWEANLRRLDTVRNADYIIGRVVEFGGLDAVRWLIREYGLERIHHFFRDVGHVEISERTKAFWRAVLKAKEEKWADPGGWRRSIGAPWIS